MRGGTSLNWFVTACLHAPLAGHEAASFARVLLPPLGKMLLTGCLCLLTETTPLVAGGMLEHVLPLRCATHGCAGGRSGTW